MKRIISFLIAILIFVLNCVPVFALDSFTHLDFQNMEVDDNYINNLNANLDSFVYIYYIKVSKDNGYPGFFIYSDLLLEFHPSNANVNVLDIYNPNSENVDFFVSEFATKFYNKTISANGWLYYNFGYKVVDYQLLIQDSNCVSEYYCSPDSYYSGESGDYEEDGVIIKGLTEFFNKMTTSLKNLNDSIIHLPQNILNGIIDLIVPDIENMKTSFNDFIDYMTTKFGFNSLIDTLHTLVDSSLNGSSVGAADLNKDFSINYNNTTIPLKFSLPFSNIINDSTKNIFDGYLKGFFFILLIFYNLSEIYFLIRGTRPFNSSRSDISMNLRTPDTVNYTKDGNIRFH